VRSEAGDFERESIPHLDTLYCYAIVFASDANEAEAWVGDAILNAHRRWTDREPDANMRTWLLTILRDIVTANRSQNGGGALEDIADYTPIPEIHDSDPQGDFFKVLRSEEILGALKRVPHEFAEAVVLSDIEGLSYAEIGEVTDTAVGTVKSRVFRGRHLLQQDLYRSALELGYQPKTASPTEP
jgi:RNA polymerase sigma-70 factor (ECF subfamily)